RGDLALHGEPGFRGDREPRPGLYALQQPIGQSDLVPRPDHRRLDRIAHRDLDLTVLVLELGAIHEGLPLAADVDEDRLLVDLEDPALDDLSDFQRLARPFAREQRGEVLLLEFLWRVSHSRSSRQNQPASRGESIRVGRRSHTAISGPITHTAPRAFSRE